MSLFQCQHCGCCDNTALAHQGFSGFAERFYDWTGFEDRKGMRLCSVCGPTRYSDGTYTGASTWHGRFERVFLPKGEFKTNDVGNLEHIATGSEDFRAFALTEPRERK